MVATSITMAAGSSMDDKAPCKNKCKLSSRLNTKDFSTSWSLHTMPLSSSSSLTLSSDKFSTTAARQKV